MVINMVNEEKVILMTKLASYETHEGKKDMVVVHYFRGDYIGFQVLKSVIAGTIAFLALLAVYLFYNFEELMQDVYKMDLLGFGKSIVIRYLCFVGGYGIISYILYATRYARARKNLRGYHSNLRKLAGMYDNKE